MTETTSAPTVLECRGLCRSFSEAGNTLHVLRDVELHVAAGERIAVVGASGSGKTTLLQVLGGLDRPTSGDVLVAGQSMASLNNTQRGLLRNRAIGFVYQFHHLLPEFTALENVAMPLLIRGVSPREASQQASELLTQVGLGERLTHKPPQLSGGERQRAAVARAVITKPAMVLADEPTGNLDGPTGERVFQLMLDLNRQFATSLVVVTHDPRLAARMDRVLVLKEGKLWPLDPGALSDPVGAVGT
jgi:lipoprotein-releasing system ATP-binding protein